MIQVQRVENKKDLKTFVNLPFVLYNNDPHWVPPLLKSEYDIFNPQKNPFYRHAAVELFLAYRDGCPCGRIAAIINDRHNGFHNEKICFFGFFEAEYEEEISFALLTAVSDYGRQNGMAALRGPVNFSTNDSCGMLIDGFERDPVIMMPYNPAYYPRRAEDFGLKKAMDLYSYLYDARNTGVKRILRLAEAVRKRHECSMIPITKRNVFQILESFKAVYNSSWEKNWGFVPMTPEELDHLALELKGILEPGLAFLLLKDGKPIGASVSLPDLNRVLKVLKGKMTLPGIFKARKAGKQIDMVRTLILGVVPEFRKQGLELLLIARMIQEGGKRGYRFADLGWILESNDLMNRELENMGAKLYKRFRIYEMGL